MITVSGKGSRNASLARQIRDTFMMAIAGAMELQTCSETLDVGVCSGYVRNLVTVCNTLKNNTL